MNIAANILKNKIKPKLINNGLSVWARIFGSTQNSWIIEFGRYLDPARAYTGWQIFRQVFNQLTFSVEMTLREEVRKGLSKWSSDIEKRLKNP